MGYGPVTPGGKQLPITPWQGSWAQQQEAKRNAQNLPTKIPQNKFVKPAKSDV